MIISDSDGYSVDLTKDGYPGMLEAHGFTPADIAHGHDIPYEPASIVHGKILRTQAATPLRFQRAVPSLPESSLWSRALIDGAQEHRGTGARTVASGRSLLVLGRTGAGKTHEAYGILRYLSCAPVMAPVQVTTAADLYARLRPRSGQDSETIFDKYMKATVLVLDDIGAEKQTEWTEEVAYRLVNYRYDHMMPTIITSNVPPGQLAAALGDRVASRLTEMCDRAIIDRSDRRYEAA